MPFKTKFKFLIFTFLAVCCLPAVYAGPDKSSFSPLFNVKNLDGWEGDKRFWSVRDGILTGETSEDNKAEKNTFLIYRAKEYSNFELRFKYQVKGFNSGIQYRSVDKGEFVVHGLQADFEAEWHKNQDTNETFDRFSGMFFEEGNRMFMGQRGDVVIVRSNPEDPKKPKIEKIASTGDPKELVKVIKRDDWNDYTVIANGNQFIHIINGRVMAIGIDEDPLNFRTTGILAFQLHAGTPMKIQIKDLKIRELK